MIIDLDYVTLQYNFPTGGSFGQLFSSLSNSSINQESSITVTSKLYIKLSKNQICIIVLLLAVYSNVCSQIKIPDLLLTLDSTIENSEQYTNEREARIAHFKQSVKKSVPGSLNEYELNSLIYNEYESYVCDSAILYQNKNIEIAVKLHDIAREYSSKLELAHLMGSVGLYKEAVDLLSGIDLNKLPKSLLIDYYNTHLKVYGELAFYTQDKRKSKDYWKVFDKNLLLIKQTLTSDNILYLQLKEDSARNAHLFKVALKLNQIWLDRVKVGSPEHALVTFRRSLIYQWSGDIENQKKYLALSAISDIRSGIKDQASLMMLAQILYEEGNIERAYRYIRFFWNATMFYNAKLRSLQSSTLLSLIDKTYQAKIEKQKSELQTYLLLISSLAVLLVFTLLVIFKQNKKLTITKINIQTANEDLNKLNAELNKLNNELTQVNQTLFSTNNALSESNKIKEVYIGRFIELCTIYINKIDDFRKKVNNKIKEGNINEAKLMTQSQDIMDVEFEELYTNFDSAFLQLFPDFVEKVNELMNEGDKFILKKGESLNPELRIMALMRLGIIDGSKISQFLRYSLTTVYNYRTKTKNRSYLQKDEFENRILQIR